MSGETLRNLLTFAWLLPLLGFCIEIFGGYWGTRTSKTAAKIAVACIALGFLCSFTALVHWGSNSHWVALEEHGDHHATGDAHGENAGHDGHAHGAVVAVAAGSSKDHSDVPTVFSGTYYTLGKFGELEVSLDWYIDSLTITMFVMVTLIATCIHVFAMGYMSDELTEDYEDHQVHGPDGGHFHRPGRFYRFFSYLSLFCFSMLGLVLAGNIFQVFVFWELVGICSYLLIGFYIERKTASDAANKAFIMNRVGDFGFIIGLMVIWTWCGNFRFAETEADGKPVPGLFQMVERTDDGHFDRDAETGVVYLQDGHGHRLTDAVGESRTIPYQLLIVAGLGIFGGCIGKSAQFPLQTWLPDAMEGPTPVSALVHSATMVAAGVYLAGRFFPVFTPEVLLAIAYIGCITLFVAATIAIVATDIKRVLAYSTISQLGYMMLGIGVFGWAAGLFHLITHAFFKSLMFLASGSVIVGCHHEQEMPRMGGLRKKMPITAYTMLIGVVAISGLAIPGLIAFSGFHSKDAIVATALAYVESNPLHFLLFLFPLVTAGLTAFYMFRLWFYTFAGEPRDQELYSHVHESPWVMTVPLLVLSVFAAFCALGGERGFLYKMLIHSEPAHVSAGVSAISEGGLEMPGHGAIHAVHHKAGTWALLAACLGTFFAWVLYGTRLIDPGEIKKQLSGVHGFLENKWHFDELYDAMFMRPVHSVARWCTAFDRTVIDGILHGTAKLTVGVSNLDRKFDETVIDGLVNFVGKATFAVGQSFRVVQTGKLAAVRDVHSNGRTRIIRFALRVVPQIDIGSRSRITILSGISHNNESCLPSICNYLPADDCRARSSLPEFEGGRGNAIHRSWGDDRHILPDTCSLHEFRFIDCRHADACRQGLDRHLEHSLQARRRRNQFTAGLTNQLDQHVGDGCELEHKKAGSGLSDTFLVA